MSVAHEVLVWIAKSYGLFYLIGLSVAVLVYVYWPANAAKFDAAARSILDEEAAPWQ